MAPGDALSNLWSALNVHDQRDPKGLNLVNCLTFSVMEGGPTSSQLFCLLFLGVSKDMPNSQPRSYCQQCFVEMSYQKI